MSATSPGNVLRANFVTGARVGKADVYAGIFARMRKTFRALWPAKASLQLAETADVSERSAERILSGEVEPSARTICALLRADTGGAVLDAIMHGADARWYRRSARARKIAELRRAQEAQRKALEQLELDLAAD